MSTTKTMAYADALAIKILAAKALGQETTCHDIATKQLQCETLHPMDGARLEREATAIHNALAGNEAKMKEANLVAQRLAVEYGFAQASTSYLISDIDYDEGHDALPTSLTMTLDTPLDGEALQERASDFISNETGFCHNGFSVSLA